MLAYTLDTNICIYVMKAYPPELGAVRRNRRIALHIQYHAWPIALRRREVGTA
jgi:hypothetical protein